MPRRPRKTPGGYVYHVLNRSVARMTIFEKDEDYQAFERVLMEAKQRYPGVQIFNYCLMPNHWHFLLRPRANGDLSQFMRFLSATHAQRYHAHYHTAGTGPVYQGRFKAFPVESESYFYVAARYVERNALRANLVDKAQDWPWSSLYVRRNGPPELKNVLSKWPIASAMPKNWLKQVNQPQTQVELEALRKSVNRGRPLGTEKWVENTATNLGLSASLSPIGRPRKKAEA